MKNPHSTAVFWICLPAMILLALGAASPSGSRLIMQSWFSSLANFWSGFWSGFLKVLSLQPPPAPTVQQLFASQLAALQDSERSLSSFYISHVGQYNISTSQSWSVQVTDANSTNGPKIGQLTIVWNGTTKSLSFQPGIRDYSISPTFAVRVTHNAFMSFSQDAIAQSTFSAIADYALYKSDGSLSYARIR